MKRRFEFLDRAGEFQPAQPLTPGPHPTAEKMIREASGTFSR
jgi:hypothetical protein